MPSDDPRPLDRFHVVLVEPGESRNVGSAARAMRNLGFRNLHLVAPRRYDPARARVTACGAASLLDALVIHDRFEDALADMEDVVGLALREGGNPATFTTLSQWTTTLPAAPPRVTALVFGPEDNGLRQEHLEQCRRVVRIPSTAECPSFNLAQSVLLVLWEVVRGLPVAAAEPALAAAEPPTWNDFRHLDRLLDAVMAESGFVRDGTPAPVPGLVRGLFRRLHLDRHEMAVLLGLFGRVHRTLVRRRERGSD